MVKVNFAKIVIKDIEGREVQADFQKQLGNQLYMQGRHLEECELGTRIYHADGEVELSEKECEMVRYFIAGYSYIARSAIENQLKKE